MELFTRLSAKKQVNLVRHSPSAPTKPASPRNQSKILDLFSISAQIMWPISG